MTLARQATARYGGDMTETPLGPATPFFIVSDLAASLAHYCDGLGFECRFASPENNPFFALVGRGQAQIMLKNVGAAPMPNPRQHADAPWDAFIYTQDPEALAREVSARGVAFHRPITTRDDGTHGFELADPDGYVCFFGHPV